MPKSRLLTESAVLGVLTSYAATIVNYGLAVVYLFILTKFIPLQQYGYYNAIMAFLSIISLFFPTLGIDNAIAREAAKAHVQGENILMYYSALFALAFTISMGNVAASISAIPILIRDGVPSWLIGIVYVNAAAVLVNMFAMVMGFYLWAAGKVATQGLGSTIGNFTYRVSELVLVAVMHNVYGIALSMLLNNIAMAAYYLSKVRVLPSLKLGYEALKARVLHFINLGMQYWLAYYIGMAFSNILAYLVFRMLGPGYSGLYGLAVTVLGLVTGFSGAVGGVFGSMASRGLAMEVDLASLAREYSRSMVAVAGAIALVAVALTPLAPMIHVLHGEYAQAVPYLALLIGIAPASTVDSVYMMYYWASGRGWLAVERTLVGAVAAIVVFIALVGKIGLYAAVVGSYANTVVTMLLYWLNNRPWGLKTGLVTALSIAMPAASALPIAVYDPALRWPIAQLAASAAFIALMLAIKPIGREVLEDTPGILRPILRPFTEH